MRANLKLGNRAELVDRLRRCGIRGAPTLKPYERATIRIDRVLIEDLVPTAKYLLEEQLQRVDALHEELSTAGIDMFELECGIVWPNGRSGRALAPPIIEHSETEGLLVVDGLHRVWTARTKGRDALSCVVISGVETPLVPLPVTWNDVRIFGVGDGPAEHEKRLYRFSDPDSLRAALPGSAVLVTEENFRYFLYRDLDELGSSGIRQAVTE